MHIYACSVVGKNHLLILGENLVTWRSKKKNVAAQDRDQNSSDGLRHL